MREAIERFRAHRGFLYEGAISSSVTLLSGEPFQGKTALALHLAHAVATGGEFLGKPLLGDSMRVSILTTELGGDRDVTNRWWSLFEDGPGDAVGVGRWGEGLWPDGLVIVDNLTGAVGGEGGSLNSDSDVHRFWNALRPFSEAGRPVVVLAHVSEKTSEGRRSTKPMGSTAIAAGARHIARLENRRNGRQRLMCQGNESEPLTLLLEYDGLRYRCLGEEHEGERKAERVARRAERRTETLDRNLRVAGELVRSCQGKTKVEAARYLGGSEALGVSEEWIRTNLSPSKPLGQLVEVDAEHVWRLKEPAMG